MAVLYKPKFCCHCGDAIDRIDWKLWTSRRFCDVCGSTQKQFDLAPRAIVAAGIFAGLVGISGFMSRTPVDPARAGSIAARTAQVSVNRHPDAANASGESAARSSVATNTFVRSELPKPRGAEPTQTKLTQPEPVYFCGAATKKGTPCSRRVKTPGRCWQHIGQPSIAGEAEASRSK